ncbi:MAG: response regulator [Paenibacillaceae bacterium]
MYHMLVVDDQQAEIDAIESLIHKYSVPFTVAQAINGEAALEYMNCYHVDLLFTDISMPFMDGLELTRQVKKVLPELKVVFYSAFSEFEYAKRAIELGTIHYMIKPINVKEFLCVLNNIIMILDEERQKKERDDLLLRGFNKGLAYEKEKLLYDLLHGRERDEQDKEMGFGGLNHLENKNMQAVLICMRKKFFDSHDLVFKEWLRVTCQHEILYLNIDEYQSLLLFTFAPASIVVDFQQELVEYGEQIKEWIESHYAQQSFIIVGSPISKLEDLHQEFSEMEELVESSFFIDSSVVWSKDDNSYHGSIDGKSLERMLQHIHASIERREYGILEQEVALLIESMRNRKHFSSMFAKIIFTDIMKKILETQGKSGVSTLKEGVEQIAKCNSMAELKSVVLNVFQENLEHSKLALGDKSRKVIEDVLNLIHKEYGNDIGVEYLASQVFLSPSYLSFLFKKITGQNVVKYITSVRMKQAKELLLESTLKVVDIARKVGYTNVSYFNLMFKQDVGLTPIQYREGDRSR